MALKAVLSFWTLTLHWNMEILELAPLWAVADGRSFMEVNSLLIPEYWAVLVALSNDLSKLFYSQVLIMAKPGLKHRLSSTHNKQTSCHAGNEKMQSFFLLKKKIG